MPPARLVEVITHRSSSEEHRVSTSTTAKPGSLRGPGEAVQAFAALVAASRHQAEPAGPDDPQLGEPQDRFQGATNLKSARWSKPSQPGGTARAERVRKVAAPGRRWLRAAAPVSSEASNVAALRSSGTTGSGHQAAMPMEGRIYDNPMRGAQVQEVDGRSPQGARKSTERINGQRKPDCVSEGEAKVTRAGPLVDPTPRRARARSPLQTQFPSPEGKKRSRRAREEGQRFTTRSGVGNTVLRPWSQWRRGQQP
jgi:hypothetical protein